ncbi:NADP-dependent oxidoreductase [Geminicoccaceae bacterium 1502E]|nr:NADP-dependent oxidoreductase [Geminicoccaceae bacterium 1502E]
MTQTQRRVLLARRPQGAPVPDDFRMDERPMPAAGEGEALVRTLWLSLDPYMRGRMSDAASYAKSTAIGEPMTAECVGEVVESCAKGLAKGDFVVGRGGWQSHFVLPGKELRKLDPQAAPLSTALGVLGMPGHTAYAGLLAIGQPKAGETVVIGAASGAVGAVAGQIAKIKGCRVVGIAGGAEKCRYVTDELGFDACLDRKEPNLAGRLKEACPDGIDIYVELTGGPVTDAVLPLLNFFARIPVIGTIASYNATAAAEGTDRLPWLLRQTLVKRLTIKGMIVWDYADMADDFRRDVAGWIRDGRFKYREDVVDGLENAPEAFIGLLEGRNFGKLLVRVAREG